MNSAALLSAWATTSCLDCSYGLFSTFVPSSRLSTQQPQFPLKFYVLPLLRILQWAPLDQRKSRSLKMACKTLWIGSRTQPWPHLPRLLLTCLVHSIHTEAAFPPLSGQAGHVSSAGPLLSLLLWSGMLSPHTCTARPTFNSSLKCHLLNHTEHLISSCDLSNRTPNPPHPALYFSHNILRFLNILYYFHIYHTIQFLLQLKHEGRDLFYSTQYVKQSLTLCRPY